MGIYAGLHVSPEGELISEEAWNAKSKEWLPSEEDRAFIQSLMQKPVMEPGKMANYIAPPTRGIKGKPIEFEYVRFH